MIPQGLDARSKGIFMSCMMGLRRSFVCLSSLRGPSPTRDLFQAATSILRGLATSCKPGLFGNPRLQNPDDFIQWAAEAEDRCNELIQQVLQSPADARVVQLLDDMSNEMCQVYDSAECCRNVHSEEQWRRAASTACQHMGTFVAEINQHQGIYQKLKASLERWQATRSAHSTPSRSTTGSSTSSSSSSNQQTLLSPSEYEQFTPETVIVGQKLQLDFEKSGIHLREASQRAAVQELMARNGHYGALFNHALADPKQLGSAHIPSQLLSPEWVRQATGRKLGSRGFTLPLDSGTLQHFLSTVPSEEARKLAFVAGNRTPAGNLHLLDDMISCRAELAHLLGFKSYAHFKCYEHTLAQEPEAAVGFLAGLSRELRPMADQEVHQLRQLKVADTGQRDVGFFAWDQDYYATRAKAAFKLQSREAAAPYLQLRSVLSGLSSLLSQLMGLKLVQVEADSVEVWGDGVTKLHVENESDGLMGTLFIDIGRHGKSPGSVLYPVICGRHVPGGGYQCPVLVLVTSCSGGHPGEEPVLTWRELRTLMHEIGHAVHNLVSRTRYQHLWGTRCAQDLVEVPSHLWEHFVTDPRSLAILARHHSSGEPMPPEMAAALEQAQHLFPALELQQQVVLSLLDLAYHGAPPPLAGQASEVWASISDHHSSIPYVPGTSPQARFNHLTIYGASYYTYLYARCLSSSVWREHLQHNPLSREAGEVIRTKLLAPGGTVEPLPLLQATLGEGHWQQQLLEWPGGGWSPRYSSLVIKANNGVA